MHARRAAVAVLALLLAGYLYGFVFNKPGSPDTAPQQAARDELVMNGVRIQGRSRGQEAWRIVADSVSADSRNAWARVMGVTDGEIFREGQPYLTFTADTGTYNSKTGELRLDGDIVVYSNGKQLLSTSQVVWKPGESKVLIPVPATVTSSTGQMDVESLEVDVETDRISSAGELVIRQMENGGTFSVRSDNIVFSPEDESFEAIGRTEIRFQIDD